MEFLAGAAVIIVLLYILGFGFSLIASGIGICLAVVTAACELFFILSLCRLVLSKKVRGTFTRIDKKGKWGFDTAYYDVGGTEISNIFPCEMTMRDKFYKKDKEVSLRLGVSGKCVYDLNAALTIIVGNLLFGGACLFLVFLFNGFFGHIR